MFASRHTPKYKVKVDGRELPPDAIAALREIAIDQSVDMADMFTITFANPQGKIADDKKFQPGKRVEVELGYEENGGKTSPVMDGEIVAVRATFPRKGAPNVRIIGYTKHHRLQRGRQVRAFNGLTYAGIARKIAAEVGLEPEAEETSPAHEMVFQRAQTNLEFLLELAARVGYEVFAGDGKLFFRKPKPASTSVRTLKRGETLLSFNPRIQAALMPSGAEVLGWDFEKKAPLSGEAKPDDVPAGMGGTKGAMDLAKTLGAAIQMEKGTAVATADEAKSIAKAALERAALGLVTASASVPGMPDLRPGLVVKVDGVGAIFSGQYYIVRVVHNFLKQGFSTELGLRRHSVEEPPVAPPAAPAQRPPTTPPPGLLRAIARAKEKKKHWVEVALFDPDGNPIPTEKTQVAGGTAPQQLAGDGTGALRVEGVEPGQQSNVRLPAFSHPVAPGEHARPAALPPRDPRVLRARWEKPKARTGEKVKLRADLVNVPPATPVEFKIFRRGAAPNDPPVATLEAVAAGAAVEAEWSWTYPEAEIEAARTGEYKPAAFFFVCEAAKAESRSGALELRDFVEIAAVLEKGGPAAGRRFRLVLPTGEARDGALDDQGRARFEDVPPGPYEVIFFAARGGAKGGRA